MRIQTKIMISIILLGLIPSVFVGAYYGHNSEVTLQKKVLDLSENSIQNKVLAINDRTFYIEKTLNTSVHNEQIMEIIDSLPDLDTVSRTVAELRIAKHFNAVVYNNNHIKSIALLPLQSETFVYGAGTASDQRQPYVEYFLNHNFQKTQLYADMIENPNEINWFIEDIGGTPQLCVAKSFKYFLYGRKIGVIVFVLDPFLFTEFAQQATSPVMISDENGYNIVDFSPMPPNLEGATIATGNNNLAIQESDDAFIISAPLRIKWTYYETIAKDDLFYELRQTKNNTYIFIAITIIVFLLLSWLLSRWLGKYLNILIQKFKRLETGDFSVQTQMPNNDEFGMIEQEYNKMVNHLEATITQNYIYKIEKQEAELNALQYQINPHFLYNTLEVINAMASLGRMDDVQKMTQNLGRLYRYNMSPKSGETVSLKQEIEHVQDYVYIQNIQMSDKLRLFVSVESHLMQESILKFVLQPLVENSIKHGFKNRTDICCIEISAFKDGNILNIHISDDGNGIEPKPLLILQNKLRALPLSIQNTQNHIGLFNVAQRIRLFYGDGSSVTISSTQNEGTTVSIQFTVKEDTR